MYVGSRNSPVAEQSIGAYRYIGVYIGVCIRENFGTCMTTYIGPKIALQHALNHAFEQALEDTSEHALHHLLEHA